MAWRSKKIRDRWESLRRRIYNAVHFAEYEMVKRGYRKCDVYDLNPDRFDEQIKRVMLDGMVYLPILRSKQYGGYGHRHYNTDIIDKDTFIYGALSRNLHYAKLFHDAGVIDLKKRINNYDEPFMISGQQFTMNPSGIDHNVTGALLGYPECCREFFTKTWLKDGCLDPMYETAENTEGVIIKGNKASVNGDPYLNRLIRYWGFNLIPFFPHSFDCVEAHQFAEQWFSLMQEYDKEASDACLEALSMPMVWSLQNCIIYVEHPLFLGSANGYYTKEKYTVEWYPQ